ncbi:hypothetical protein ACJ73_09493, partial [Blastomyces percursus]
WGWRTFSVSSRDRNLPNSGGRVLRSSRLWRLFSQREILAASGLGVTLGPAPQRHGGA